MSIFGYARATVVDPLDSQLEALRAHSVPDAMMFVEADAAPAAPAWTRLLARLTPRGDQVVITRPHVLAATGRQLVARCEEVVRGRGGHVTPIVATIPERITLRGGGSQWMARQTGR